MRAAHRFTGTFQTLQHYLLTLLVALALSGCQATMQKIADCKAGDWTVIGHKDGYAGVLQNFEERSKFCSRHTEGGQPADAVALYQAGWAKGDWAAWSEKGQADGRAFLPLSQVDAHIAKLPKDHAPANRPAYESGWLVGNSAYWQATGQAAGLPRDRLPGRAYGVIVTLALPKPKRPSDPVACTCTV